MKKITFIIYFSICVLNIFAQKNGMSIDAAVEACIAMRDAVATKDPTAIKQSADALKGCGARNFMELQCNDDTTYPPTGHLVFDEAFAYSLVDGENSYSFRTDSYRGQTSNGAIRTKTCFVEGGKSIHYSFLSKGHKELAVVAEAGGKITLKIRVTNNAGLDKRYDDTINVTKGMPHRKVSFDLPNDKRNTVELEVINCTDKDISFVVISN